MKHETGERNKYIKAKGTIKHQRFTKDRKCYAEHSNTRPSILANARESPIRLRRQMTKTKRKNRFACNIVTIDLGLIDF